MPLWVLWLSALRHNGCEVTPREPERVVALTDLLGRPTAKIRYRNLTDPPSRRYALPVMLRPRGVGEQTDENATKMLSRPSLCRWTAMLRLAPQRAESNPGTRCAGTASSKQGSSPDWPSTGETLEDTRLAVLVNIGRSGGGRESIWHRTIGAD